MNTRCREERDVTDTNDGAHLRLSMFRFKHVEHVINRVDIAVGDPLVNVDENVRETKREHECLDLLGDRVWFEAPSVSWLGSVGCDVSQSSLDQIDVLGAGPNIELRLGE